MAENWGDYRVRARDVMGGIYKTTGHDVYCWWDNDSSRFRCHWRNQELLPQANFKAGETVDGATARMVEAWSAEISKRAEDARPAS